MILATTLEHHTIFSWIDAVYVILGGIGYLAMAKVWGGNTARGNGELAESTIGLLQTQLNSLKDQMKTQEDSFNRHSAQSDKIIDDLRERNKKLEEQVKTLSIIPWQKAEERHVELMQAIAQMSKGQVALSEGQVALSKVLKDFIKSGKGKRKANNAKQVN